MLHSAFSNVPIIGKPAAGYMVDEEAGVRHIVTPAHVKAMNKRERSRWMDDRGIVPTASERSFVDRAREILEATRRRYPFAENTMNAYSMFEMMQPFSSSDDVSVTTNAETALTNDEYLALPANFFSFPGKCAWFRCMGKQSNVVTTPGTYTFRVRWSTPVAGGGVAGSVLQASAAITPSTTAVTDNLWWMDFYVKCLAMGKLTTSLSLLAWGFVYMANEIVPTTNALWQSRYMPPGGTALANVASLDGTVAKALTATTAPTVTTGSITVRDAYIVAMN